ncbi:uncharacterized protein DUF2800 [Hydrogenispora ethanolica]|uniref:Uncharacterized protein DUF2800 n=1 Tax=Hydrogenispora ethanolica TaxID=1082276 RepID=A0A4R1RJK8_HYDET|nr:DUF2800 domain-containing protein [Hydrogenispora ethanolica]TCL65872.1 uncharacterized protein DUF2800 [Hydrogenispora ethanolica]
MAKKSKPAHAVLSASGSHKWLNCPPSARLEELEPEETSKYAEEGSLAHQIGELKLKKYLTEPMGLKTFNNRLGKIKTDPLFQEEMLRHTDTYVDYIQKVVHSFSSPPYVAIEKKIDFSAYVPDGFGTGDFVAVGGDTLCISDLKYGKGVPVSAERNPQMMLYALGVLLEFSLFYDIKKVKLAIIQPRLDSISEFEMSVEELLAWGESIKPIAQMAYKGEGEFCPGEHCRFCRAKAICRARTNTYTALEDFGKALPPTLSNEEVGAILNRAKDLANWVSSLEEYALSECLAGREIPGWKIVEGRTSREYTNQDDAFRYLINSGVQEVMLYERKPLTVPAIEKMLGRSEYVRLLENSGYVAWKPGKPTLAPESDKRAAYNPRSSAAEDFGGEIA